MAEKPKPNLVVFCGAGFSVGAGLPTMLSFSHALRKCEAISAADKADFERIQIACSAMTGMTDASSRNLEDLASLLSVLNLSQPTFSFGECDKHRSPEEALALLNNCIKCVFAPENHNYESNATKLLDPICRESDLSIVTTNYDMNIEIGAVTSGIQLEVSPWVKEACLSNSEVPNARCHSIYRSAFHQYGDVKPLKLFKLHGSVNWYRGESFVVEDRWTAGPRVGPNGPQDPHTLGPAKGNGHDARRRRLVLPAVIKADGIADLQPEWQGASSAMACADAIWFIGYSFPETDSFMRYFLAGALQRNTRVQQIAIMDPNAMMIVDRTEDLFGSAELRELVKPFPTAWENIRQHFTSILRHQWKPSTAHDYFRELRDVQEASRVMYAKSESQDQERRGRRDRGR